MATPTCKTVNHLRQCGYVCGVVERWLPKIERRKDFLGCIDIVAAKRGEVIAVQATAISCMSARLAKAKAIPELRIWLQAARFEVWGWQRRPSGWVLKRVEVKGDDMATTVVERPVRKGKATAGLFDGIALQEALSEMNQTGSATISTQAHGIKKLRFLLRGAAFSSLPGTTPPIASLVLCGLGRTASPTNLRSHGT